MADWAKEIMKLVFVPYWGSLFLIGLKLFHLQILFPCFRPLLGGFISNPVKNSTVIHSIVSFRPLLGGFISNQRFGMG